MSKYPLLEMLRAERQRQEDEIADPLRDVIDGLSMRVRQLTESIRALERMVGSELGKAAVDQIGREVGVALRQHIMKALPEAHRAAGAFTLTLPTDILRFMDPRSLEREILDRYAAETAPRLSLRADTRMKDSVTVLDIRIPELGYRTAMTDLH